VGALVDAAKVDGWEVHLVATPAALDFLDVNQLESQTGHPVRSAYRPAGQPRHTTPAADAIIVAPATLNTINKLAAGVADNYALGVLAECIGIGVPTVVLPFINSAMASRSPLRASVGKLREEGVHVLLGPDGFRPHPAGAGGTRLASFPWIRALHTASAMVSRTGRDALDQSPDGP
jgi:phosphopantothenoylcysteine synthetase/decarboxylase